MDWKLSGKAKDSLARDIPDIDIQTNNSYISVMTEISDISRSTKLPEAVQRFVLQWGDLGSQWGVNRSVSQIQALLYLSDKPMTAEDIADQLGLARSNVSNSLRELLTWSLVRRVPLLNDRRDHYEAEADLWEMATRIAAGRKAREIDPALAALRACMADADKDHTVSKTARTRLKAMLTFTEQVDRFYGQMLAMPRSKRDLILKLGSKITSFLPGSKV
jgi:DNA-binding transcriptional regulator GbsR (MarR family)